MKIFTQALAIGVFAILFSSCTKSNKVQILDSKKLTRVETLLSQMTLEEKIGQMNQYNGFWDATGPLPKEEDNNWKFDHLKAGKVGSVLNVSGVEQVKSLQKMVVEETRLGIPLIFGFDVIHGHKTLSPIPLAESASWDLDAIQRSAEVAAIEASARGLNWTFAPMVDISRDPRWGRVMEGAGEDTYLGSKIAMARVKGFQGSDLSKNNTIAACAKHFAGYGFVEGGKDYNTVDVGSTTLHNVILPPFKACVDAGVSTFMNSFNILNGVPATGDEYLMRDILKDQWAFEGFVVSDWSSGKEMIAHGFSADLKQVAVQSANAGSDMDMESYAYVTHLKDAVEEGLVDVKHIDDAAKRVLQIKEDLGLLDDPYKYCDDSREKNLINHEDHHKAALDMAIKSIVLLKNESGLLPLKGKDSNLAVIGHLAEDKNSPLGSWRIGSDDNTAVSVLEGLDQLGIDYKYAKGPALYSGETSFFNHVKLNDQDKTGMNEAIALAKSSDQVLLVVGEHGYMSGEGRSRANIDLPGLQQELIEEVYKVNKNVILVVMSGRPLVLTWAEENVPTILQTWHLGTQSGNAIAEVISGNYNPSGKLPMTFPRSVGQIPVYYNQFNTGRPGPLPVVFWAHYSDESNEPLFPFGHGLSYTTFEYSDLKLTNNYENLKEIVVTVKLTNSGSLKGKEVVQLYLQDQVGSIVRPIKELKGFELVELESGESTTVRITLTDKELGFYNQQGKFLVEPGDFKIFVGGSSETKLEDSFTI